MSQNKEAQQIVNDLRRDPVGTRQRLDEEVAQSIADVKEKMIKKVNDIKVDR